MNNLQLSEKIKHVEDYQELELDLSRYKLKTVPQEIFRLTHIKKLDLSHNEFSSIPSEIGLLENLTSLNLNNNLLTNLPSEIGNLRTLEELSLFNNQIRDFPSGIEQIITIRILHLGLNRIESLESFIKELANLEILDLYDNLLLEIPNEIGDLSLLRTLNIGNNKLRLLPPEICNLSQLQSLIANDNQIAQLPEGIGALTNLITLNLSNNRITDLPLSFEKSIKLTQLNLEKNPIPIPPEILAKIDEPNSIINYYQKFRTGQIRPINEAKMLLVGQGSVGKTSIVNRLVYNKFDPLVNKTEGIEIIRWKIKLPFSSARRSVKNEVRVNIWDFGGQEILHATHQFFLTKRSLYLLIIDNRLGEEENRVEYWLKIIRSFGGDSPVIIVGNKVDQHPLDLDFHGLRRKYNNIKDFVEVSCFTSQGIEELNRAISREIGALPHVNDHLLNTWFSVKTRLEELELDYMQYDDYKQLCEEKGIFEDLDQRTLLRFLHDLGIVLNYEDDPRLEDTNILNPEWITNAVYRILNSYELFESKGILDRKILIKILDTLKYPREKHMFIIDMMRKFELCFDFEGYDSRYLIPDLLPKQEVYTGEWNDTLAFQYHYNVLPGSIISRFIVRMHPYIYQNTVWRNGVVLSSGKDLLALIKADREEKKILIFIKSNERFDRSYKNQERSFLAVIRSHFDFIHSTIPGIEVEEKVPLPKAPEVVVDYEHLLNLEAMGVSNFVPEGLKQEVHVSELLDGVDTKERRQERRSFHFQDSFPQQKLEKELNDNYKDRLPEATIELSKVKSRLDENAKEYGKRILWFYLGILVLYWIVVIFLNITLGWSTIEPWTYIIGIGFTILSYSYFVITLKEFTPIAIYERMIENKKLKNYEEFGFDMEKYNRLIQ